MAQRTSLSSSDTLNNPPDRDAILLEVVHPNI
jgi:hypothetical protein